MATKQCTGSLFLPADGVLTTRTSIGLSYAAGGGLGTALVPPRPLRLHRIFPPAGSHQGAVIRSLDDAAVFVRGHHGRWPSAGGRITARIGIILHDCGGKRRATRRWRNLAQDWCAVLELPDALCSCKRQRVASATIISGPVVGSSSLHLALWRL